MKKSRATLSFQTSIQGFGPSRHNALPLSRFDEQEYVLVGFNQVQAIANCHGKRNFFSRDFFPRKMTIYSTFLGWMSRLFPHSPLTFEGIFIEILNGPFGIFNKIGTLLILSLTILLRSWISVINQNQPKLPLYTHFFASSGHDLVNFNKKYQLAPFLVLYVSSIQSKIYSLLLLFLKVAITR